MLKLAFPRAHWVDRPRTLSYGIDLGDFLQRRTDDAPHADVKDQLDELEDHGNGDAQVEAEGAAHGRDDGAILNLENMRANLICRS